MAEVHKANHSCKGEEAEVPVKDILSQQQNEP